MAMFVGLDVSLRTTSICVVEADGSQVWEGKAESEPTSLVSKPPRYLNGCTAHSSKAVSRRCASRPVTLSGFSLRDRIRPTAAMRGVSPT